MGGDGAEGDQQVKKARRWLPGGLRGCLLLAVLLVAMPFYWPSGCNVIEAATWRVDHARFDSEAWRRADAHDFDCARGGMVWELLATRRLSGLTRAQVEALLGPPDNLGEQWPTRPLGEVTNPEIAMMQAEAWEYCIGYCSGFRIDPDFLVVTFGGDGRVSKYYTYQG